MGDHKVLREARLMKTKGVSLRSYVCNHGLAMVARDDCYLRFPTQAT